MPATRYGGTLPDVKYGFELTVEPPVNTSEAQPVRQGEVFRLVGATAADGSGYKAVPAVAADTPGSTLLGVAKHALHNSVEDLGVKVITATTEVEVLVW